TMTTYPPLVRTGVISQSLVLGVQAHRDQDSQLDTGFHYFAVDWIVSGLDCPGITVSTGAVVAVDFAASQYGIILNGTPIGSQTTPVDRSTIVWTHAVQEGLCASPPSGAATIYVPSD